MLHKLGTLKHIDTIMFDIDTPMPTDTLTQRTCAEPNVCVCMFEPKMQMEENLCCLAKNNSIFITIRK